MPGERTFLLPGEMAFHREAGTISTLLGSCVAVSLHDRRRAWSGLNHYLVPEPTGTLEPGKVGSSAIAGLVQLATMAGSAPTDLDAQIHGGAALIGAGIGDIGLRNVELARHRLAGLRIPVTAEAVGGGSGRRIDLDTASGRVEVRELRRQARAAGPRTRVLIVDDSPLVRQLLRKVIAASDDLEVAGEAEDPFAARELILALEPQVICLDLIMPKLDGLSFLRRLMQYKPIPTVVVSTIAKAGSAMHAKVIAAGAVAVIDKEALALYRGPDVAQGVLLPALRAAALRAAHLPSGAHP